MEKPMFSDDVVGLKKDVRVKGVILRTQADVETHRQMADLSIVRRGDKVSTAEYNEYNSTGIPPSGTVVVQWTEDEAIQLERKSELVLLDRPLYIGDVVKRNQRDAMSGVILNVEARCNLQPIKKFSYKDSHTVQGHLPPGDMLPELKLIDSGSILTDIPASELDYVRQPDEDDLIVYKDWIGRVVDAHHAVVLLLTDRCVVELDEARLLENPQNNEPVYVGDLCLTKKGDLRKGRWIFGEYNPNTPPVGLAVSTRATMLGVDWIQKRIGSTDSEEPPGMLEREELEAVHFQVLDRTRRPGRESIPSETVSNEDLELQLDMRVRFKDGVQASCRYNGSTSHGKFNRIPRQEMMGYDANVFDVVAVATDAYVQWQNLSITRESSLDLVPDSTTDDEHAAWPGEVAHSVEMDEQGRFVSKVGIIQSVRPAERMAQIRWAPDGIVEYQKVDDEEGEVTQKVVAALIGLATGDVQDVSLYDVKAPGSLNVHRGDIALIGEVPWTLPPYTRPTRESGEWLGEIVDTPLDGTLTVRLIAAPVVRDVVVSREQVVVAIRCDGTNVLDDWASSDGMGYDDDYDDDDELDDAEDTDATDYEAVPLTAPGPEHYHPNGTLMLEPRPTYEDENGEPLAEDEVENAEWESDDEEPQTETVAPDHDQQTKYSPPAYLILDEPVPRDQFWETFQGKSSPALTKRIQKEHRILQKPGAIPDGIYIRSWESRLDLIRVLFVGPAETPYRYAPFLVDFHLGPNFPVEPPEAYFHSWPTESGLGGSGKVNPNLYEDGKICLSLLGTWEHQNKAEGWNPSTSTFLQVIVSIQGLVLVAEPYFNEAGYELLVGLESSKRPSVLYSELAYLRARSFLIYANTHLNEISSFEGILRWLYRDATGPKLLGKAIADVNETITNSEVEGSEPDGMVVVSRGLCVPLRRVLTRLRQLEGQ
ncbi:hypothetical protein K470DRAFT_253947 [Piedraia hortae CBS 480.64]|uniref:UBC core domain-containing protein n=1 Tax=Piedraia hortae CBS 480.64 TaxID=1314780 RepID=A0A6A7CB28_9PEZI|nr:hypothetical protein K470DRAFT_253947 [Piedraia hortae CBS 480.64]